MTNYGPDNPHPLSQMTTELVWEGKYDEFGNRREVDVAGLAMPLQRIETIDEPQSRVAAQGGLFDDVQAHHDDFRNQLIWGDNKLVMASLLENFKGAISLIYIDPPFDVGEDFTMNVPIGEANEAVGKEQSIVEMIAFRDMWGKGMNSYLQMLHERLSVMRELLSDKGSIYIHVGPNVSHYVKALCDDVFGVSNYLNTIIWQRFSFHADAGRYGIVHDEILFYSKSKEKIWNPQYAPLKESYIKSHFRNKDGDGRKYKLADILAKGDGPPRNFGDKTMTPPAGTHWRFGQQKIDQLLSEGRIVFTSKGKPAVKLYLDEKEGSVVHDIWTDVFPINPQAKERLGYATQKPEALLSRVINASSNEGDLVADFFCGSGTTLSVAEQLGRKWVGCDLGRFAVHTATKRMIGTQRDLHQQGKPYRSFDVYNLGRYERQWWQQESLKGADGEHRSVVLKFFRAEVLSQAPSPMLHGRKGTAFVHVDSIDSIFTREEAGEVAKAVISAGGREVHCLAWDFEMDLRQAVTGIEVELSVKVRLHRIPREIMERNRTEVPPFFEIALLEVEGVQHKNEKGYKTTDVKLVNFLPSLAEVPSKELEALQERALESGFDFIDFWAVDFDWSPNQPFNHHWQDYRTRKGRELKTVSNAEFVYENSGKHTICVKVVDVFGCDTSITVEVET